MLHYYSMVLQGGSVQWSKGPMKCIRLQTAIRQPKYFNASFLGTNQLTDQPRLGVKNPDGSFTFDPNKNYTSVNSYFVENGSYLKLKNLQVGYTFTNPELSKVGIKSARIFVMTNNLFTITKYTGLDPELGSAFSMAAQSGFVGNAVGVTTRGLDAVSQYPQVRLILWDLTLISNHIIKLITMSKKIYFIVFSLAVLAGCKKDPGL